MKLKPIIISLQLATIAAGTHHSVHADNSLPTFDWQTASSCPTSQCCGAFVPPELTRQWANLPPAHAPTEIGADNFVDQDGIMTLSGRVELFQGWRSATADSATFNRDTETAELTGNIFVRQPQWAVSGSKATIDNTNASSLISDGKFVLYSINANGAADSVSFINNNLALENLVFTTCNPISPDWVLQGESLAIDADKGQGTGRNLSLKIGDTKVFWWPYLRFPTGEKRLSGLLWPRIGVSDADGFEYAQPYYINLAPNYDATITPHLFTKRGLLVNGEFRHLGQYGHTEVSGGYLYDDDITSSDRWLRQLQHQGQFKWLTTTANWAETSDVNYLRDLHSEGLSVNRDTALTQLAQARVKLGSHWQASVTSEYYQPLHIGTRDGHRIAPELQLSGNYHWQTGQLQTTAQLDHRVTEFTHDTQTLAAVQRWGVADEGKRSLIDYSLSTGLYRQWGYINAGVQARQLSFELDARNSSHAFAAYSADKQTIDALTTELDLGLVFERALALAGANMVSTIEPRLHYFNTPYQHQVGAPVFESTQLSPSYSNLFVPRWQSGNDRIDDGERISAGVTSRFISATTGLERLRISIGQGFYNGNRYAALNPALTPAVIDAHQTQGLTSDTLDQLHQLTRSRTNLEAEASTQLSNHWYLQTGIGYDTELNQGEHSHVMAWYRGQQAQFVSISASQRALPSTADAITGQLRNRDVAQTSIGTVWPLSGQYKVIANLTHDFTNERLLEGLLGLSYESCCWQASLGYRQWVDNRLNTEVELQETKRGIVLQFRLKGLGGSRQIDNSLYKSMYGYEQNFNNLF